MPGMSLLAWQVVYHQEDKTSLPSKKKPHEKMCIDTRSEPIYTPSRAAAVIQYQVYFDQSYLTRSPGHPREPPLPNVIPNQPESSPMPTELLKVASTARANGGADNPPKLQNKRPGVVGQSQKGCVIERREQSQRGVVRSSYGSVGGEVYVFRKRGRNAEECPPPFAVLPCSTS